MKKIFFVSVFIFCLISTVVGQKAVKIAENLYHVPNVYCNVVFYVAEDGVVVVDAGSTTEEGKQVVEAIKEITDKPIQYVFITHYHFDHTYGLAAFPLGVKIIAQEGVVSNIKRDEEKVMRQVDIDLPEKIMAIKDDIEETKKVMCTYELDSILNSTIAKLEAKKLIQHVYPTETFEHSYQLILGRDTIVAEYPGSCHTDDNCMVEFLSINTIHLGDILFCKSFPYMDVKGGMNSDNWVKTLNEIGQRKYAHIIGGHGPIATLEDVLILAEYMHVLKLQMRKLVEQGVSVDDMKKHLNLAKYNYFDRPALLNQNIKAVYSELVPDKD